MALLHSFTLFAPAFAVVGLVSSALWAVAAIALAVQYDRLRLELHALKRYELALS